QRRVGGRVRVTGRARGGINRHSLAGGELPPSPPASAPFGFEGPVDALRLVEASLEDRPFALVAGQVGGSGAPGTARCAAIGVSPLSGGVAETRAEGPFAAGLRAAGVTGIVLYGRAPEPVCVVISDGRATIEPAGDLWGSETGPATDRLLERHGSGAAVAVIGPAGGRQIPYASIVTCRHHPLPRLGLGAVLGARNVKAIVAVGDAPVPVADPAAVARIAATYAAEAATNQLTVWQRGTPGFGVWAGEPGYAPVDGFTDTTRGGGLGVVPDAIARAAGVAACPGCPTDCIKVYAGAGLHQEALAMLGPNAGIADPWPLLARCEQLGLDPVEVGAALAEAVLSGAEVPVGPDRIEHLPAARMTTKGVAVPPFDPRVQPNLGLAYAVSPIGPRYDLIEHDLDFDPDEGMPSSFPEMRRLGVEVPRPRGRLDVDGTAQLMRLWSGLDALGVCLFAATPTRPLRLSQVEDLVEAVTGRRPDVLALGAERLRLQFAINRRLGLGPSGDTLPDLFFDEPVRAGRYTGSVLDRAVFSEAVAALRERLTSP
ncbi:aldehyde ferredoxin oxidoreductase N-terminal domain-containing protein, partial [Actinoplanes sp. NPDC051411]|uniref:aldehyde ferredoxin oxidoreductase N-terminal domain-containing protein n=1 Tax=Actinoplanes sp. NPDC051411 TaxID=3155522 RepID=UPI00344612AD